MLFPIFFEVIPENSSDGDNIPQKKKILSLGEYPAAVGVRGTAAADAKSARYRGLGWGGLAPVTG